jgi:hypothetical protein
VVYDAVSRKNVRREYDRHNNAYMLVYERTWRKEAVAAAPTVGAAPPAQGVQPVQLPLAVSADTTENPQADANDRSPASPGAAAGSESAAGSDTVLAESAGPGDTDGGGADCGPTQLYYDVMTANLRFQHDQHVLHDDYFGFVATILVNAGVADHKAKEAATAEPTGEQSRAGDAKLLAAVDIAVDFLCNVLLRLNRLKRGKVTIQRWEQAMRSLLGRSFVCRQQFLVHFLADAGPGTRDADAVTLDEFLFRCSCEQAQRFFLDHLKMALCDPRDLPEVSPPSGLAPDLVPFLAPDEPSEDTPHRLVVRQLVQLLDTVKPTDRRSFVSLDHYFQLIHHLGAMSNMARVMLWEAGAVGAFLRFRSEIDAAASQDIKRWYPFAWLHASLCQLLRRAVWIPAAARADPDAERGYPTFHMQETPFHPARHEIINLNERPNFLSQIGASTGNCSAYNYDLEVSYVDMTPL